MSTSMHAFAQKLLERPDAPQQVEAMRVALEDEKRRREEFYEWVTEEMKAEFINGEIIIQSPVKRQLWKVSDLLSRLLSVYTSVKKTGSIVVEKVMISLSRNDYEPNICFFSSEKTAMFKEDQVLFPAPDFVVEILSKKTSVIDRNIKKAGYAAHGIREYWIVDPVKQEIEQYLLLSEADTEYFNPYRLRIGEDIESRVIEGFNIPVLAIFNTEANVKALKTLIGNY